MTSSTNVERECWHIFTFYALHGNPLDPEHIRASQLVKLARDCQLTGSAISEADPPLSDADINVAFTAEVTRADKVAPGHGDGVLMRAKMAPVRPLGPLVSLDRKKMNYCDFLTCLMKLSGKIYPRSRSKDEAFQRLLMDNLLPLAARRCPDSVEAFLENADVKALFDYYSSALEQIFTFYCSSDKRAHATNTAASSAFAASSGGGLGATGSGAGMGMSHSGRSPIRATRAINSMKEALGYQEFLKFAADFDLSSSVILSTIELGDIFLSSIKDVQPDATMRKLTFVEFWEVLVRCALVAYGKISDATILDKIRGLLLYMWRAINQSVPRAWADDRRNVSTNVSDLLAGAMLFNKRFTAQWAADGYRDYLSPEVRKSETGQSMLSRLMRSDTDSARALQATYDTAALSSSLGGGNNSGGAAAAYGGGGSGSGEGGRGGGGSALSYAALMQQQGQRGGGGGGGSSSFGY